VFKKSVRLKTSEKNMHFVLSSDLLDYIIQNVLAHFELYNPKLYDTPHELGTSLRCMGRKCDIFGLLISQ
jgi:hypothetical protein